MNFCRWSGTRLSRPIPCAISLRFAADRNQPTSLPPGISFLAHDNLRRSQLDTAFRTGLHSLPLGADDSARELPQRGDVAAVVTRLVHRCLQDERAYRERRMIQDSTECFETDLPFADVLVPIETGA